MALVARNRGQNGFFFSFMGFYGFYASLLVSTGMNFTAITKFHYWELNLKANIRDLYTKPLCSQDCNHF